MEPKDFVLYRDPKTNAIKSLGYEINSILPYMNMPAMKGGGNIPGKKSNNKLTLPSGLVLIHKTINEKLKQAETHKSYINQDEGSTMFPEHLHDQLLKMVDDKSNKKSHSTRKVAKFNSSRKTRKKKL